MFNIDDVKRVSKILSIKFDKFTPLDLLNGMNIELEHGLVNPETNVSNDDLVITTKTGKNSNNFLFFVFINKIRKT